MSTSRETVRDGLVALLAPALVGEGLPVKTVTGSKVLDMTGQILVMVLSKGSSRPAGTAMGNFADFALEIYVFVPQSGTDWTATQAEDTLDAIEALIAGVIEDNRRTDLWGYLMYDGDSRVGETDPALEGTPYYIEVIPIMIKIFQS